MWPLQIPGPWERVLDPTLGLALVALAFGLLWTVVNFYTFFPLAQGVVERVVARLNPSPSTDGGGVPSLPPDPPTIDVFLAAYEEAAVIDRAIESVLDARYPADRLRLTVLLEPGDDATRDVVEWFSDDDRVDVLVVPEAYPGDPNKPRALNYGFEHTDADIVGVVDAEDVVAEELFVEAADAFAAGADYAQARLDMANEGDGWLNLLFRAEYGYWYNLVTPNFTNVGYPVPLAGTSCFVRRDVLETASEHRLDARGDPWTLEDWAWVLDRGLAGVRPWDQRNVTEDFELGLLLWELDYDFAYLDSVTAEESPLGLDGWLDQRTRWQKGKVFTYLDRSADPPASRGDRLHVTWQSVLPHLGPLNITGAVLIGLAASLAKFRPAFLVGVVLSFAAAFALITATLFSVGYWLASDAPRRTRLRRAVVVAVTLPLYWLLQWLADARALIRVYGGDLAWEHTTHVRSDADLDGTAPADVERARRYTLGRWTRVAALGAIVAVAAILRRFALADWGLWTDELYTVTIRGAAAVPDILVFGSDPHPPLYYVLVHWWMELFGTGAVTVRALSILFSLAAVVAVYLLGTELFDDRTGLLAALFVSVSAFHVHFGRVARMYSLLVFLTALSLYYFARLRDGTTHSSVGYVLATTALVYTHVYGLFVVAGQLGYATLSEHNGGVPRTRWYRLLGALGLLALPWLGLLSARVVGIVFGTGGAVIQWIPEPSAVLLTETLTAFVGFPALYPVTAGSLPLYVLASAVVVVFVFQLLASIVRVDAQQVTLEDVGGIGLLVAVVAGVTLLPFLLSYAVPIYVPRYAAPASVPFVVLGARGLRNVPARRLRFGLLAVLLVSSFVFLVPYYTTGTAEPWAEVSADLEPNLAEDEVIVSQPPTGAMEYYLNRDDVRMVSLPEERRLSASDLAYLGGLARDHTRLTLIRYYQPVGPAYNYLGRCYSEFSYSTRGAIAVARYRGPVDCPAPEAVLDDTMVRPEPTSRNPL